MRIAIIIPTRQTRNSEGKTGSSRLPVKQCNIYQEKGGRTHEFTRGFTRLRIIISEWRGSVPRRNNFSFEGHSRFHEEMIFLSRGKSRGNSWYPPNVFPDEYHCFTGRRETCCLKGITPATEVSLHLVLALQFHLPALVSWRCSILVQTILRDGADVASMFLSFAGFTFIFF